MTGGLNGHRRYISAKLDSVIERVAERAAVRTLNYLYPHLEGLITVHAMLAGSAPLPRLRGWALGGDSLGIIFRRIASLTRPTVLEFGSGCSTIALARLLSKHGGRLVSIEHDEQFAAALGHRLESEGTSSAVTLHCVPLVPTVDCPADRSILTYDFSLLPTVDWDCAIIDGPIGSIDSLTRLGPLTWVADHLVDRHAKTVFLDDANRPGETEALELVSKRLPAGYTIARIPTEKGLAVICEDPIPLD